MRLTRKIPCGRQGFQSGRPHRGLVWSALSLTAALLLSGFPFGGRTAASSDPWQRGFSVQRAGIHPLHRPVVLEGSVLPAMRFAHRLGPLDPHRALAVGVSLRPRNAAGLERFLRDVYDPHSPLYHHFLTPHQFAERFGASQSATERVASWLRRKGLRIVQQFRNGLEITARGNAAQLEGAFSTRLYRYRLGNRSLFANATPVHLPADLAPAIAAVSGLTNTARARPAGIHPHTVPHQVPQGYGPHDLAKLYDIAPLYSAGVTGSGQTIAIVAHSDFSDANVAAYNNQFGLPGSIERVPINDGTTQGVGLTDDENEVETDIELAHGIAPNAHLLVYEGTNSSAGAIAIYNRIVSDRRAQIVTTSFGDYERDLTSNELQSLDTAFREAAAQGQAIFAASGDAGAYDEAGTPRGDPQALAVDFPASDPWVTGVGGTILEPDSEGNYGSEAAWSDTRDPNSGTGSGGGLSLVYARPDYQTGPGVSNQYSNGKRQVPDVAAMADSPQAGYAIYTVDRQTTGWVQFGGTSAATPLWAAYTALLNQRLGHPVGFFNPVLYSLGRQNASFSRHPFHDVTEGTNLYYPATPGWDFATGWGSMDAAALATDVSAQPLPTSTPAPSPTATPTATPRPIRQMAIPVRARLSATAIHRGSRLTLALQTVSGATVQILVQYPGGSRLTLGGRTDSHGRLQRGWLVRTSRVGKATVTLLIVQGRNQRRYTLHFRVT